jgi:hypothetical protein
VSFFRNGKLPYGERQTFHDSTSFVARRISTIAAFAFARLASGRRIDATNTSPTRRASKGPWKQQGGAGHGENYGARDDRAKPDRKK